MAIAMSLAFLISFLVIQQISAVSSDIPTPTIKPPVIVTMHVGQPITITQQSQNVTSHIPVFTVCPFGAHTSDNASCATSYQPTVTPICSTTLSPLAAPEIPITACNQKVAFSSNYGFDFAPASGERGYHGPSMSGQEATGSVNRLTIYYVAPWTDLSAGAVPTGIVEAVTCSAEGCSTQLQQWGTQAREVTMTTTHTVQFQAQITGPANVIIGPNATTISVSALSGTTISYSTIVTATQTSTSINIIKSAAAGETGDAAAPVLPVAASGERADVAGGVVTATIRTTYTRTRTRTMISASGAASLSANGTAGEIT